MQTKTFVARIASVVLLTFAFTGLAQAGLVNFDLTSGDGADAFGTGAAVFGSSTSKWNEYSRFNSATNLALSDETGAATSVTLSYSRLMSGFITPPTNGTYGDLGMSHVLAGTVTLSGLIDNATYQLAIYSNWGGTPGFTVNGITETVSGGPAGTWSTLTEGTEYVLFTAAADSNGQLSFTPIANGGITLPGSYWSALQIQQVESVPEPASLWLLAITLGALVVARRVAPKF